MQRELSRIRKFNNVGVPEREIPESGKRAGLKFQEEILWPSAYAGSNPVSHTYFLKNCISIIQTTDAPDNRPRQIYK